MSETICIILVDTVNSNNWASFVNYRNPCLPVSYILSNFSQPFFLFHYYQFNQF